MWFLKKKKQVIQKCIFWPNLGLEIELKIKSIHIDQFFSVLRMHSYKETITNQHSTKTTVLSFSLQRYKNINIAGSTNCTRTYGIETELQYNSRGTLALHLCLGLDLLWGSLQVGKRRVDSNLSATRSYLWTT